MKGYSVKKLSSYFGYTRDGYYKSLEMDVKEDLTRSVLIESVLEIRTKHPRMGGRKMYL